MGCIDGFGGPLPQSWINRENNLQKKILRRERNLGMTPVLQGFTGHIPAAFIKKIPNLHYSNLTWLDFPKTYLLDWQDPLFIKIGTDFITELKKEYGTDHLYAVDQFIEMIPSSGDTGYLKNMSRMIFSAINRADPEGKWVIQTWPFRETEFWNQSRTKAYFEGAPDNRMLALELMGEYWPLTGWYKHQGWYGKPWIWSVISNFGDNVSMYGGLVQIAENFQKALSSPDRGKLCGMGLMMEGLDYNPVIYKYVTNMMWESGVPDLNHWKKKYIQSRYGFVNKNIIRSWDNIFNHYYTIPGQFEVNPIIKRPWLVTEDIIPSEAAIQSAHILLGISDTLKNNDAYQFDMVNLCRQIFGQYAGHLLFDITASYQDMKIEKFDKSVRAFTLLAEKIEQLLATREEFLLGKWIGDSKERAENEQEEELYEWNAKAIITTWGGRILYGYAIKDWAGMYSLYYLPKWQKLFAAMRTEISGGDKLNYANFMNDLILWEDNWLDVRIRDLKSRPTGDPISVAKELWDEFGEDMISFGNQYRNKIPK
jgi:alpha-N-acetylglucosaminidase